MQCASVKRPIIVVLYNKLRPTMYNVTSSVYRHIGVELYNYLEPTAYDVHVISIH